MMSTLSRCVLFGWFTHIVFGSSGKEYLNEGYSGIDLDKDGSFQAVGLTDLHWNNASCSQSGFRDFYIDATSANMEDNLFVEVVHNPTATNDVQLQKLSIHLFFNEIPADRTTNIVKRTSPTGIYSFAVNANEIREGRYYISVKCGDFEDANFGIIAKFDSAEQQEGIIREHFICPKESLYHFIHVNESDITDEQYNVRFTLCAPSESLSKLTLVSKVHYPPLRRTEPQKLLSPAEANQTGISDTVCVTFDVCNSALEEGKIWAGVFGSGRCGYYNMTATFFGGANHTDETCTPEAGGEYEEEVASPIVLEQVYRGSCKPYEWVDYKLVLNKNDRANNILFEVRQLPLHPPIFHPKKHVSEQKESCSILFTSLQVIDTSTGGVNPRSLSVHLFSNSIPVNRLTENRYEIRLFFPRC